MNKIKVFLSSRVNPTFNGLDQPSYDLGMLRQSIKRKLEAETFLGDKAIKVIINELTFEQPFTKDSFQACLDKVSESDVVIILFTGDAGWAPENDNQSNGICHEEFLKAVQDHPSMTFGIDLTSYFTHIKYKLDQQKRNKSFALDVKLYNRFRESPNSKTVKELEDSVLDLIKGYIRSSIDSAFKAKKEIDSTNVVFGKTLDWSKLNYSRRNEEMKTITDDAFKGLLNDTVINCHSIPDNMSVSDARNLMGRPFLTEHVDIDHHSFHSGVVHIVSVYGSATELQVKNIIGYPDLTAIKAPFGYYVWEQTTQIQMFFLSHCINPNTIKTRKQQVKNWLETSKELNNVYKRAQARHTILKAVNKAIVIARGS